VIQTSASPYLATARLSQLLLPNRFKSFESIHPCTTRKQAPPARAHRHEHRVRLTTFTAASISIAAQLINAAPFFFNQDSNIPADQKVPGLHRYTLGGTVGAPIKRINSSAFSAISTRTSRTKSSASRASPFPTPFKRSLGRRLAAIANEIRDLDYRANVDPIALALFNYKLPNGNFLIPNDTGRIPFPYRRQRHAPYRPLLVR